jgi:hypothetical protein
MGGDTASKTPRRLHQSIGGQYLNRVCRLKTYANTANLATEQAPNLGDEIAVRFCRSGSTKSSAGHRTVEKLASKDNDTGEASSITFVRDAQFLLEAAATENT